MKIFISQQVPGGIIFEHDTEPYVRVRAWEDVCRNKESFVWIRHSPYRDLSRWTHTERKLPFIVSIKHPKKTGTMELSAHKTLTAAVAAAEKYVKEHEVKAKAQPKSNAEYEMVVSEVKNIIITNYIEKLAPTSLEDLATRFKVIKETVRSMLDWTYFDIIEEKGKLVAYPSRILLATLLKKARG